MNTYKRLISWGVLIEQEQKYSKRVVIGLDVSRIGLDLDYGNINFILSDVALDLNWDTTQYDGMLYKKATVEKGRVILHPY